MLHKSIFSIEVAVANCSEAMEADTISKNGRSSKSQMSRGLLIFISFLLTVFVGNAQTIEELFAPSVRIRIVQEGGKYGIIDKTCKEIVPCKYDDATSFSEGIACVKLNGKWGYVDETGKEITPFKYDNAYSFSQGLARVKLNEKYGYIDKTGREITPIKYSLAEDMMVNGITIVALGGKLEEDEYEWEVIGGKYGFIDKTGKEIIPCKYDGAKFFNEGIACVKLNGKWGYIDKTGKEVVPLKYDKIFGFSEREGLAPVMLNGKWGFIDRTGKEVIPLKYDYAYSFYDGSAKVRLGNESFRIDKNGNKTDR